MRGYAKDLNKKPQRRARHSKAAKAILLLAIALFAIMPLFSPVKAQASGGGAAYIIYHRNNDSGGGAGLSVNEYQLGAPFPPLLSGSAVRSFGWEPDGMTFAGWSESASGGSVFKPPSTLTSDLNLYAIWDRAYTTVYKVTYNANGGSGTAPTDSTQYQPGETVRVKGNETGLALAGYQFSGWSLSKGGSPVSSFTIASDITLYASWVQSQEASLSVTYNANGGTGAVPIDNVLYRHDATVTVKGNNGNPPLTKANFAFAGWALNTSSAPVTSFKIASNTTLYAVWVKNNLTVTYNANGGEGTVPKDSTIYKYNETVSVKSGDLTRDGYLFKGWSIKKNGSAVNSFKILADTNLYAVWANNSFKVTYSANGGTGAVPKDEAKYKEGDTVETLPQGSLKKDGFGFIGWATSKSGSPVKSFEILQDTTLYAIWSEGSLFLSFDANGGMGDPPLNKEFESPGQVYDLSLAGRGSMTRPGYKFTGWSLSPDGSTIGSLEVSGSVTVYAVWVEGTETYIVRFDGNGGTIKDDDNTRSIDPTESFEGLPEAPKREGYDFTGWNTERDGTGIAVTQGSKITENIVLYAQWEKKSSLANVGLIIKILLALMLLGLTGAAAFMMLSKRKQLVRRYRHY